MLFNRLILILLVYSSFSFSVYASQKSYAAEHLVIFSNFIDDSLTGKGRDAFDQMVQDVENNIQWSEGKRKNKYLDAYHRSYPFMRALERDDVPLTVLLIPYLESTWHGKKGNPSSDYGYWQMLPEVIDEIQQLDQASDDLMTMDTNDVRSDADLSTEAALIHMHRYYFYFHSVAGFSESDSWLFAITAYNWGAGNIKAMIAQMEDKGKTVDFSSFYHYLYTLNKKKGGDKSSRVALEYLPNLWNIALLIQEKDKLAKK